MRIFFDKLLKYWPLVLGALAFIAWGYNHDISLARASSVVKLRTELNLMYKEFKNEQTRRDIQFEVQAKTLRAEKVQEQMWVLEERFEGKRMTKTAREHYRELQIELQKLRNEGY